jgi:type IV pilus assembly protein PilO
MKLWIYTGVCVLSILYFAWDFYSKDWERYHTENDRLTQLIEEKKAELGRIMTQNQRRGKLKEEIKRAEADFKRLKEMFPDRDFIPKRLQDITKASRRSFVVPISFRPLKITEKDFYQENQYEIKVASSYHGLGTFFEEIANFKYPTSIDKVSISQNELVRKSESPGAFGDMTSTTITRFQLKTYTSKK